MVTPLDRNILSAEIEEWLPPRIYDVHAHFHRNEDFGSDNAYRKTGKPLPQLFATMPFKDGRLGWRQYISSVGRLLHAGRETSALCFAFPFADLDVDAANQWVAQQVAKDPTGRSRAQMIVTPATTRADISAAVREQGVVGLKCYHVFADPDTEGCTFNSPVEAFLPEHLVAAADAHGLTITLHLVRATALSDPANSATVRRYCSRYRNMKLILAHVARGFNMHHTIAALHSLRGLDNVYFDTVVVTESGAMEAVLRDPHFGPRRLLYGSDFPASHIRGRCVGVGDSFLWISPGNCDLSASYAPGGEIQTALVGVEALRALKLACDNAGVGREGVELIMCGNAERLYGLAPGARDSARRRRRRVCSVCATLGLLSLVFVR